MGGLLYKDFVSVNRINKAKLTWILAVLTVLYIGLRIAFPGTADRNAFLVESEDGQIVNLVDTFFDSAGAVSGWNFSAYERLGRQACRV